MCYRRITCLFIPCTYKTKVCFAWEWEFFFFQHKIQSDLPSLVTAGDNIYVTDQSQICNGIDFIFPNSSELQKDFTVSSEHSLHLDWTF